ncbi:CCCH-type Zn-finger protein [Haematococcus lacustris]|uniref:CCCH-type Zn-finger protein n=1 Tax=Haematococcus lacustris TaxID=44745 RepID=A0A699ZME9_HAELA|nr:CCCH-type Zn-finger protein [Haematococcus lacustris]
MLSGAQLLTSQLQGGQGQLLLQQPQQLSSAVPAAAMPAAILGLSVAQCASLGLSLAAPGGAGATAGAGAARHSHSSGSGLGPVKQHALYKTEMCKGWMEAGTCRYGHKCQFAHGAEELRPVPRHPKYKTEAGYPSAGW